MLHTADDVLQPRFREDLAANKDQVLLTKHYKREGLCHSASLQKQLQLQKWAISKNGSYHLLVLMNLFSKWVILARVINDQVFTERISGRFSEWVPKELSVKTNEEF